MTHVPAPLRRCLVVLAVVPLAACSWLVRPDQPTPNLSATRVGTGAPASTAAPDRSPSPTGSPDRSATPTATTPPLAGSVAAMTADSWGQVRFDALAAAARDVVWEPACSAWLLLSSGGTRVGEAQTTTGSADAPVFAIRVDHPAVTGPDGLTVGTPEGVVRQVFPDARSGATETSAWLWHEEGSSEFVTQLDRDTGAVVAMLVLPAGKGPQSFPTRAAC